MTSQTEELLGIVENIAKIKKLLNELRGLTNTKPIDRGRCIQILSELYAPSSALVISFITYLAKQKGFSILAYELANNVESLIYSFFDKIDAIKKECRQNTLSSDDAISHLISEQYSKITSYLSAIEQVLGIPSGLKHLAPLIEKYGFGSEWIVATAYLAAMEVAVNRKLKELGVSVKTKDSKDHFNNRVDALLKELERRGVQLGELEKLLPDDFWRLRNEVVHGGYTPSYEELQTIVTHVSNFLEKIGALRSP